ncbi:GntR family transcriptional regulator [Georgenia thermotolerans]|uniref:GntR family transcriptional regulator n=1 Tax=Georgenia thermotolerans TaxID=527326 RepID=A0A7J5UQB3_9MICO|nr:GntR family transcriptional regulator [Georgenia thermotolerans]KAE8764605.1 GntR family transcriptional regulator [Georgenia thermotolerans]
MSTVEIEVDTRSPVPHYEQIRSQVTRLVLTGALPEGARLPPIRRLAGHLGLSNGAVARAYRELEREGTVITAGKKGTTVAPLDTRARTEGHEADRDQALADAATTYAITAHRLGYSLNDAVSALRHAMTPDSGQASS